VHYKYVVSYLTVVDSYHIVYMCRIVMVRLAQDGEEGKLVYRELVSHMWDDVDVKSKKLGV